MREEYREKWDKELKEATFDPGPDVDVYHSDGTPAESGSYGERSRAGDGERRPPDVYTSVEGAEKAKKLCTDHVAILAGGKDGLSRTSEFWLDRAESKLIFEDLPKVDGLGKPGKPGKPGRRGGCVYYMMDNPEVMVVKGAERFTYLHFIGRVLRKGRECMGPIGADVQDWFSVWMRGYWLDWESRKTPHIEYEFLIPRETPWKKLSRKPVEFDNRHLPREFRATVNVRRRKPWEGSKVRAALQKVRRNLRVKKGGGKGAFTSGDVAVAKHDQARKTAEAEVDRGPYIAK
jgi:hypothetical protein